MDKKVISLSVDKEIYDQYRKICEERGWILSKQIENFLANEIERIEKE